MSPALLPAVWATAAATTLACLVAAVTTIVHRRRHRRRLRRDTAINAAREQSTDDALWHIHTTLWRYEHDQWRANGSPVFEVTKR